MKKYPVSPSARKFRAVPTTIWFARRWIEKKAWINARPPPAAIAITRPSSQLPVLSAPQIPKNAPDSIIPSSAMFTTPLRSRDRPDPGRDREEADDDRNQRRPRDERWERQVEGEQAEDDPDVPDRPRPAREPAQDRAGGRLDAAQGVPPWRGTRRVNRARSALRSLPPGAQTVPTPDAWAADSDVPARDRGSGRQLRRRGRSAPG